MTPRHFAWQAWHNVISTFVSRGRRGVMSHPPSFCVAGVALMALGGALGLVLVACDAAALCVAVAQCHIHLRFTRQVWPNNVTSTFVSRGRRGAMSHPPSFCVAGILGRLWSRVTPRHFAWQAWHNVISTFVSRGRRGIMSHAPSFLCGRRGTYGTGWRAWAGFSRL